MQEYSVLNSELDLLQTLDGIQEIEIINDSLIYRSNNQIKLKGITVTVQ